MPIIRKVENGNGMMIRTVSLGTLFAVVGLLVSVIGAQATWLLSAKVERALVAAEFKETLHAAEQASITRAIMVESDIKDLATRVLALERQVAINTGILTEHQKER